ESPYGLNLAQSSSVLSLEGKDQVCEERVGFIGRRFKSGDEPNRRADHLVYQRSRLTTLSVNPRPSPTHSTRESEWAKAEIVLKCYTSVFLRNRVDL
ncbi:hypothetical protein H5410_002566, partial [Solanum commersonii]